jgi:hypothetical protein
VDTRDIDSLWKVGEVECERGVVDDNGDDAADSEKLDRIGVLARDETCDCNGEMLSRRNVGGRAVTASVVHVVGRRGAMNVRAVSGGACGTTLEGKGESDVVGANADARSGLDQLREPRPTTDLAEALAVAVLDKDGFG